MSTEQELKNISDRVKNGETISESEMLELVDKCSETELLNVFSYCMNKEG